jgi:hypothetical protein
MRQYSKETIEKFTEHVRQKAEGFNYLLEHNYRELLATLDAIRGDKSAFAFLMKTKQFELAAFVNAIWEDSRAFKMLMDKKVYDWAAVANIVNGDEKAIEFLKRSGKLHYINLAIAIQQRVREDNDKQSNIFNMMNIFKKE